MTGPAVAPAPAPAAAGSVKQEDVERPAAAPFTPPITPMVRSEREHPFEREISAPSLMPTERDFAQMMKIADMLAQSGFMPAKLNTAGKVLAVIMTGRELGLPPMLSTRSIKIMEDTGLPIVAADVLLGAFKRQGGKSRFLTLDDKRGELWLKHPNGDEYTEIFTIEDAKRAGLTEKRGGNWLKWPKQMIRSRCITGGLKSLGWEPAAGVYDADEAEEIAESSGLAPTIVGTMSSTGELQPTDAEPKRPAVRIGGKLLDEKKPDSDDYAIGFSGLVANLDWGGEKLGEATGNTADEAKWERFILAVKTEIARRYVEEITAAGEDDSVAAAIDAHYKEKLGAERYAAIIEKIDQEGVFTP